MATRSRKAAEGAAAAARRHGDVAYAPARTKLGARLRRLRRRIIEEGTPLLTGAEVRKEVAERRGGGRS